MKKKSTGYSSHQPGLLNRDNVQESSVWERTTLLLIKMGTAIFQ